MYRRLMLLWAGCVALASLDAAPKIIAHRGASKEAPENTLCAFANALTMPVDGIEFDVHLTKDGIAIILHDHVYGRTTNGGFLKRTTDLTYDEIRLLDNGAWFSASHCGEPVPTLQQVLELAKGDIPLIVEVKKQNSPPEVIAEVVVEALKGAQCPFFVGSFDPRILKAVHELDPSIKLIGIYEEANMKETILESGVKHVAVWWALLSEAIISEFHANGIEVWTFTVDNPALAGYLNAIGVDGIISNDPRHLIEADLDL